MARIRQIEIKNFRGIASLVWDPSPGINCLVGPGDSGKSTILDAIDLCIGARRTVQFADSDFHALDVENPISISVTVGELSDALKTMDAYGLYLRGYNDLVGCVEEEPGTHNETVPTVNTAHTGHSACNARGRTNSARPVSLPPSFPRNATSSSERTSQPPASRSRRGPPPTPPCSTLRGRAADRDRRQLMACSVIRRDVTGCGCLTSR
ncbi:MAG: DUF2813 domain-containing protein [Phenylobacterium sp.]|uniref:ATP-dependent nuclease n=1 Tax=Phenylobacterium sp. TaxID=1871053 RepID=UPI00120A9D16|nr:AAA family ATPase [Phenylobacterium sp.]TAL37690.1 MAG: DUF2813 domain-containing protein [Phenylobacterium sp.]